MNATLNHAPRKQLSDQLDRLDYILDGLSDAIPQVVADAVLHATKTAVKAAVDELLANPQFLQALQAQQQATPSATPATSSPLPASTSESVAPAKPSLWSRLTQGAWNSVKWVGQQLRHVGSFVVGTVAWLARASVACVRYCTYPIVSAALAVVELAFGVRRGWSFSPA